jgi:hypothetical protein
MARMADRKLSRKQERGPAADPRWDRKQGTPKDEQMARHVERSSGRYSASEQSEEKARRSKR